MEEKELKINDLKVRHREVGRLYFQGFSPTEIASRVGMSKETVYNILKNPLCQSYIQGLIDKADTEVINVRKKLITMNAPALETVGSFLHPDSTAPASVRLNAAKDVLDRNGYKAPERHEHLHGHFTTKDLKELQDRAKAVNTDYLN